MKEHGPMYELEANCQMSQSRPLSSETQDHVAIAREADLGCTTECNPPGAVRLFV